MADAVAIAISLTEFIGRTAAMEVTAEETVMPFARFVAGLGIIPGLGAAVTAIDLAEPIIKRIAVGAPIAAKLIQDGAPALTAIINAGPTLLTDIKALYAVAFNNDPSHLGGDLTASAVSDEAAISFAALSGLFGRPYTNDEVQKLLDDRLTENKG